MTIDPILAAPLAIQLHLVAALVALGLTPLMLLGRKGTRVHKRMGRIWVFAMALTALSSFAISEIRLLGPWSPIHILSVITLVSLWNAVRAARARRIAAHQGYIYGAAAGLVGAGGFTLLPGRLLSKTLPEGYDWAVFAVIVALALWAAIALVRRERAAVRAARN